MRRNLSEPSPEYTMPNSIVHRPISWTRVHMRASSVQIWVQVILSLKSTEPFVFNS